MSPQDLLFIVLAIGFAVLVVFGSIALWQLTQTLKSFQQTSDHLNQITVIIESSIEKAATIADNISGIASSITGLVDGLTHRRKEKNGR